MNIHCYNIIYQAGITSIVNYHMFAPICENEVTFLRHKLVLHDENNVKMSILVEH